MTEEQGADGGPPVVRRVTPPVAGGDFAEWGRKRPQTPAAPKFAPRSKVTAEDMEARFTALRAGRQARKAGRTPRSMSGAVRTAVAAAMGVGIIGFGLGINAANIQHEADMKAGQSKLASLSGAVEAVSPENGKDTPKKLTGALAAAQKRSDALAAAQQQFAEIAYAGNADPGTNDGRPKPSVLRSVDHRKSLAAFFAPESLVLTDAEAYSFRTDDLLEPGRIDPRMPWFTRYDPAAGASAARNASDPKSYTWKTASVTLSGSPGVMSVVWTNTDAGTGELLAWATARYSVDNNTFRSLTVTRTTRGESQQLTPKTADTTKGAKA